MPTGKRLGEPRLMDFTTGGEITKRLMAPVLDENDGWIAWVPVERCSACGKVHEVDHCQAAAEREDPPWFQAEDGQIFDYDW